MTTEEVSEIRSALAGIAAEAGSEAWIYASVNPARDGAFVRATLYPGGITSRHVIVGSGMCFGSAIADLRSKWELDKVKVERNLIRKMALAIIEITTDQGGCSDAALRGAGFAQPQITRLGQQACEEASRLAAGGPFAIIATGGITPDIGGS